MDTTDTAANVSGENREEIIDVLPFVNGEFCSSSTEAYMSSINPSTGEKLCDVPEGSVRDVDLAVLSSKSAFDERSWVDAPPSHKKMVLHRFGDLIAAEADVLDYLDALEMGKPIALGAFSAISAAALMHFYAESIDKLSGTHFNSDSTSMAVQRLVPRGVVAAITPWNFPTYNATMKIAPALAAGNSVVLKPSELSNQSSLRIVQLGLDAGLPPGVLNLVPGLGATVGQALGLHMAVDMITFTGSTSVGKHMMQYSGNSNMKAVIAECGGKSPQIVCGDCTDLDIIADNIVQSVTMNQGQVCSMGSRLLVERNIEAKLTEKVLERFEKIATGEATDPNTSYGPVVTKQQLNKILAYIESGKEDGADLVCGGDKVNNEKNGNYIKPTAFINVPETAKIAREEIFGPVLSVMGFNDTDDAIRLANSTSYGLAAYVWTNDSRKGLKIANNVNAAVTCLNAAAPAGEGAGHAFSAEPYGMSGTGTEGGMDGLESFCRRHFLWVNHG